MVLFGGVAKTIDLEEKGDSTGTKIFLAHSDGGIADKSGDGGDEVFELIDRVSERTR